MLNTIDFFQFDNLVRNRVPFLFLNLSGTSLDSRFALLDKTHLRNYEVLYDGDNCLSEIEQRKLPKEFPVVLYSEDPYTAEAIVKNLANLGYINAYMVRG